MVEPGGSPGLLGTRNRQLLVDVNQIGLKAVSPFKGLDRGAVPAGDGSQRIALFHGVGACLGSGLARGALSGARAAGGFAAGRGFPRGGFLADGRLGGRIIGVTGRAGGALHRAVMAGFISGIRAFRDPRRDFAAGRFRSVVTGRGGILGGAGREGEYQRGSAGAG